MTTVVNSLVQWDGVFVSDSLNLSLLRALVAIIIAEVMDTWFLFSKKVQMIWIS